jgi:hypothetical protein
MLKKITLFIVVFAIVFVYFYTNTVLADAPPDPGGGPGGGDGPVGGGSPIGSGLLMLLGMGLFYGIKNIRNFFKK